MVPTDMYAEQYPIVSGDSIGWNLRKLWC